MQRFEAALNQTLSQGNVGRDRRRSAFKLHRAKRLQIEEISKQFLGIPVQHNTARFGQRLQPSSEVWGFAHHAALQAIT